MITVGFRAEACQRSARPAVLAALGLPLEEPAERHATAVEPALEGAGVESKQLACLLVREALDVAQDDRESVKSRKLSQRLLEPYVVLGGRLERRRPDAEVGGVGDVVEYDGAATYLSSNQAAGLAHRDPEEPGRERGVAPDAGKGAPCSTEGLPAGLFGEVRLAESSGE